ncbi:hypothetical protein [Pedobacter alpinus]|uniref:Outer membrane lipoprotein-sorting protein n=1 Tax=Pedobacter alpinus TaxID=1590643 RepID=A0ABW5TQ34_9SPHI
MKKLLFLCAFLFSFISLVNAQSKAEIFEKVWKAVGGKSTFEKSRYLEFDFAAERNGKSNQPRKHFWDRYTGDYRLEMPQSDGKKMVVLFNTNTQKGKAYENGILVPDSLNNQLVKRAYASFINDTYWLITPVKLEDPGVNTNLEADELINGINCHTIHLNFDKVGLTPGDQYWLYVNDKTGEVVRWKFLLQKQQNTSVFDWTPYQDLGNGLKLSTRKTNLANQSSIYFPVARVLDTLDKNTFTKP